MKASLINFHTKILATYYKNKETIEKVVPQTAQISKQEQNVSKSTRQLEFGVEHLFSETAREVHFFILCSFGTQHDQ